VGYPDLYRAVIDNFNAMPVDAIVIEDAGNGTALIQDLRRNTKLPVIAWPCENKFVKATRAQPTVEAGNCSIPEDDAGNDAFVEEHEMFPNGENDDQVDTTSMMCDYFRINTPEPRIRSL
jgi:predicted phage terminase large subunit-like protein